MIKELTNDIYDDFISNSKLSVVKVGAPWCGPCRAVAPILDKVSNDMTDVQFGNVDADDNSDLSNKILMLSGSRSIPTTVFYRNGKVLKSHIGSYNESGLISIINEVKSM